jgi:hypothetical protein
VAKKMILDLNSADAKAFYMQSTNYSSINLPEYFDFRGLLKEVDRQLKLDVLAKNKYPSKKNGAANYIFLSNKDGRYGWRPLELIHPVLYVDLINLVTLDANWKALQTRIKYLSKKSPNITCTSWPVVNSSRQKQQARQISQWWADMEQSSIVLSMEYRHLFKADITNCYGSIYTHSIAWAIHDKEVAKKNHSYSLFGNQIDTCIQAMRHGETNGIPQGSVVMDFIAEIVLRYIDSILSEKLKKAKIKDYKILRYRDDYSIFVNDPTAGRVILKLLTEVLADFKMQLNNNKIHETDDIIQGSIKNDKLQLLKLPLFVTKMVTDRNSVHVENINGFQKTLLQIYDFTNSHPNSSAVVSALQELRSRLEIAKASKMEVRPCVAILTSMIEKNPTLIPIVISLISKLTEDLAERDKESLVKQIIYKLRLIPNTGYLDIYVQRMAFSVFPEQEYDEHLSKVVIKDSLQKSLWNNDWLKSINNNLKKTVEQTKIIDRNKLNRTKWAIRVRETNLFDNVYPS